MNIMLVDDEELALGQLKDAVRKVLPEADIYDFLDYDELLDAVKTIPCDIAFLDIKMRGKTGLALAKEIKDILPRVNIIFVTGYNQYMGEAFSLRASGYLLKPVTPEQISEEMENLRNPVIEAMPQIRVQTFGNFDIYNNEIPVTFTRSKSKEALAYLVDRQGTAVTYGELASVLWEDGLYDRSRQKQLQTIVSDMIKSLEGADIKNIVIRNRKNVMVDKTKFYCDYYRFLEGDPTEVNRYCGQYMDCYSWAEFTVGFLNNKY